MLRQALGEHFGIDFSSRKQSVRQLVTAYLEAGGPPEAYRQKKAAREAAAREAEEKARRAERERRKREREERERRAVYAGRRVVVVGAGPSGLTAALHLKVGAVQGDLV